MKKLLLLISYLLLPLQGIGMELLVPYLTHKSSRQKKEAEDNNNNINDISSYNREFNNEDPFFIKRDRIISTEHIWLHAPRPHNPDLFVQIAAEKYTIDFQELPIEKANNYHLNIALQMNSILKNFEEFGISLWILEDKQTKEVLGYNGIEISKKTYEWKYALLKKHYNLDYITETTPFIFNRFFNKNNYQNAIIYTSIECGDTDKTELAKKWGMKNKTTRTHRLQKQLYFTLTYPEWNKHKTS